MRTEDTCPAEQSCPLVGILNQDSPPTTRSSRSSSRSSSSSDSSYSSCDRSRSPSVLHRSRRLRRHRSRYSSSSSSGSRSRSCPRCCRASGRSGCCLRHRSRSYSPYSSRSFRYGRRRYSRSTSRSSSRERYYRRSRRSRSRSSSYRRTSVVYSGRVRCRFSPSPLRRSYRPKSRSPERSVWLSQKDKIELLNIAKENAAKILGVDAVKLPASVKSIGDQIEKPLEGDIERRDKGQMAKDVELFKTSPVRKAINFSINNIVAKPSSSPTLSVPDSKVTSRADSVGNRLPYGQWIPVKKFSSKKR